LRGVFNEDDSLWDEAETQHYKELPVILTKMWAGNAKKYSFLRNECHHWNSKKQTGPNDVSQGTPVLDNLSVYMYIQRVRMPYSYSKLTWIYRKEEESG